MRYTYQASQWLPYPVPRVFGFFANPDNLPRLMPGWQAARIDQITLVPPPPAPPDAQATIAAGTGTRMTLTFRPVPFSPIRLAWDAEIAEFAWHDHFCDIQLRRGPFAYWRHCHNLRAETRDGVPGTLLTDQVVYEPPLGPLGALANRLILSHQIKSAFAFRQKRTAELLAGGLP
ncbi:MAG: SRPBCC family protein [Acidobacteriaceae bacterium]